MIAINPYTDLRVIYDDTMASRGRETADDAMRTIAKRIARAASSLLYKIDQSYNIDIDNLEIESFAREYGDIVSHISWSKLLDSDYVTARIVNMKSLGRGGNLIAWGLASCAALFDTDPFNSVQRVAYAYEKQRLWYLNNETSQSIISAYFPVATPSPQWDTRLFHKDYDRVYPEYKLLIPHYTQSQISTLIYKCIEWLINNCQSLDKSELVIVQAVLVDIRHATFGRLPSESALRLKQLDDRLSRQIIDLSEIFKYQPDLSEFEMRLQREAIGAILDISDSHVFVACCKAIRHLQQGYINYNTVLTFRELRSLIIE